MALYRKKPVVIEAHQWDGTLVSAKEIMDWSGDEVVCMGLGMEPHHLSIDTLEGEMRADPWDWIIKGVKGEYYPCKPDIFEATYEAAE
jgi:hypothetical protein